VKALARPAVAHFVRERRGFVPIALWLVVGVIAAFVARANDGNGADRVLRGTFGTVVLPLLAYGVISSLLGRKRLGHAIRGTVAVGGAPSRAALATVLVAMAASALLCGFAAMLLCVLAHGETDPPLAADMFGSFGVAVEGGAAYAAFFCAGSAIGGGAMRGAFLTLDFLLGVPAGVGAIFTPRAHVMSLLGGRVCYELSRRESSFVLAVLALVYLAVAVRFGRRAR
jgi:hypothetical protein